MSFAAPLIQRINSISLWTLGGVRHERLTDVDEQFLPTALRSHHRHSRDKAGEHHQLAGPPDDVR